MNISLKDRVFYVIRRVDVELAEGFMSRCPDTHDLTELNAFFHTTLATYGESSREVRTALRADVSVEVWISTFERYVLPQVVTMRWPPLTMRAPQNTYNEGCTV